MRLNEQQESATRSLNQNAVFLVYLEALETEYQQAIKSLLNASGEQLLRQQGRASTLRRLIDVTKAAK